MTAVFRKLMILTLALLLLICPALADHSVLPAEKVLDETQALDLALGYLCGQLALPEEEIRGHWFYSSYYQEEGVYFDESTGEIADAGGPMWSIDLINPETAGTYEITDYVPDKENGNEFGFREIRTPWPVLRDYHLRISAGDGSLLKAETTEYYLPKQGEEFWLILVPRKDQLQPQEALNRAYGLLTDALGLPEEKVRAAFRDYVITASSALGEKRCWYHVELNASGNLSREKGFHVYLDMDSGEIVRQTDPDMIAGRFALWQQGLDHDTWFHEQLTAQETEWGPRETWDYRMNAAFEERCFGMPFNVMLLSMGLPDENDCSLEEAEKAARSTLPQPADKWTLTGSSFWTDFWGDMLTRLSEFNTEPERVWQLDFVSPDGQKETVYIDPVTCEPADGSRG